MRHLTDGSETPKGIVVGDRAYFAVAKTKHFHEPLRRLGYTLVGDYKFNQLGKRGSYETMGLVEGHWYCPAMPKPLVEATEDFYAGRIDEATYNQRINERRAFALRRKGKYCTNKASVSIPNKEGMRYRQTGPAFKAPEWKKVYGPWRNVIETRNDYVKNNRGGAAIGDHTRRPVREAA